MSDATTCPLCGGPNACGMAAGEATCWCHDISIDAAVLARIPEPDRSRRCVCQPCATEPGPNVPDPPLE